MTARIYLSPPHLTGRELHYLQDALASNWIAPLGPHVDAFESEIAAATGVEHALGLASGTAALHLALLCLGVTQGDEVFCSSLTFVASANAIRYAGAEPVFIDSDAETWTMDPELLRAELARCAAAGRTPKAVIVVDIYGQCADYERIIEVCREYGVTVIEDAAESLGARYHGRPAGGLADLAILSFNGNKIITASGGGMLLTNRRSWADRARHLATQAREPVPHYEHRTVGYNYRLSNLLAAVGRAQLEALPERVHRRREVNRAYREALSDVPGLAFMPEASYGTSNCWLTCVTLNPELCQVPLASVAQQLGADNIECRPVWKPMHLQPAYRDCRSVGGDVSRGLFERGLCLPSGSSMTNADLDRVTTALRCALMSH